MQKKSIVSGRKETETAQQQKRSLNRLSDTPVDAVSPHCKVRKVVNGAHAISE